MTSEPLSADDPRPDGRCCYIESHCDDCGALLVLQDELEPPEDGLIWHDEWACPICRDGVYLDLPPGEVEELRRAVQEPTFLMEEEA